MSFGAAVSRHPRTSVTVSRVMQGVSTFGFAAAAVNGVVGAAVALAVSALAGVAGSLVAGSLGSLLVLLRDRLVWVAAGVGAVALVLAAEAYQMAAVATVSFLLLLVPLFAGLMAPLFGERLGRGDVLGMGIGLVGIACFARPSEDFESEWMGIVLALLAGLSVGLLWHQSRALARRDWDPWATTLAQTVAPGAIGLVIVLALGRLPGGHALAWLVVSGLGYAANTVLRLLGLKMLTASKAALIAPVSALTSTTLAALVLGQIPDALTLLGAVLIVVGVIVAQLPFPGTRTASQ